MTTYKDCVIGRIGNSTCLLDKWLDKVRAEYGVFIDDCEKLHVSYQGCAKLILIAIAFGVK